MTQRISREQCVPKEGGLETRPYKAPDLCAASRKGDTRELPLRVKLRRTHIEQF